MRQGFLDCPFFLQQRPHIGSIPIHGATKYPGAAFFPDPQQAMRGQRPEDDAAMAIPDRHHGRVPMPGGMTLKGRA